MAASEEIVKHHHAINTWTVVNLCSILFSLTSITTIVIGGLHVVTAMELSTKEIPRLQEVQNNQEKEIAVLQDQQKYADSRYAEIMLQLARINAKLDKQNEYLYDSLQRRGTK